MRGRVDCRRFFFFFRRRRAFSPELRPPRAPLSRRCLVSRVFSSRVRRYITPIHHVPGPHLSFLFGSPRHPTHNTLCNKIPPLSPVAPSPPIAVVPAGAPAAVRRSSCCRAPLAPRPWPPTKRAFDDHRSARDHHTNAPQTSKRQVGSSRPRPRKHPPPHPLASPTTSARAHFS